MLDRDVVRDFLEDKFEEAQIELPENIKLDALVETFCLYVENDYYEWLNDNYKSFFEGSDWSWIRGKIRKYQNEYKENFA